MTKNWLLSFKPKTSGGYNRPESPRTSLAMLTPHPRRELYRKLGIGEGDMVGFL